MNTTWLYGILAALVVAGISSSIVQYGRLGTMESEIRTNTRDIERLYERGRNDTERIARLEERDISFTKELEACRRAH